MPGEPLAAPTSPMQGSEPPSEGAARAGVYKKDTVAGKRPPLTSRPATSNRILQKSQGQV